MEIKSHIAKLGLGKLITGAKVLNSYQCLLKIKNKKTLIIERTVRYYIGVKKYQKLHR